MNRTCLVCNAKFHAYPCQIKVGGGKYCSRLCANRRPDKKTVWNKGKKGIYSKETIELMKANRKTYRGEQHASWNDNPTYSGVHQWVYRVLGKPDTCTDCGFVSNNNRLIHWANISGEYKRDESDWVRLCIKCHFKMDKIHEKGWATRKAR